MGKVQFKYSVKAGYAPLKYKTKTIDVQFPVNKYNNILFDDLASVIKKYLTDNKMEWHRLVWYRFVE